MIRITTCTFGPRKCQHKATHWHHAFGEVCGYHARQIEQDCPGEKCKQFKGSLVSKLYGNPCDTGER